MFNSEEVKKWLEQLLDLMLIKDAQIEIFESEPNHWRINLNVQPEDSGSLIGYRGDGLQSLQRLIRIIFTDSKHEFSQKNSDETISDPESESSYNWQRITLNINDYLEEKAERLRQSALRAAHKVLDTGRAYRLHSLSSAERFIIHNEISQNPEFSELESFSENDDSGRVLIIRYKTL